MSTFSEISLNAIENLYKDGLFNVQAENQVRAIGQPSGKKGTLCI